MRNIILLTILLSFSTSQSRSQSRQWDRPMQLKSCTIEIKADLFTATTFMELEFCNPNKQEIEGLFRFALKPGQIITAFQLDLHGKYRDGSIEEKWKATNAYNTIVGKRIDPALLTMEYADHYSLRIYPVPANGCRKVTITIQQVLKADKNELMYSLPMDISDTVHNFKLNIAVNGSSPAVRPGLISTRYFSRTNAYHNLSWHADNLLLKKEIAFSIPVPTQPSFCTKTVQDITHFALRFQPSFPDEYDLHPARLTVFWDASASVAKRDINREISFLKQFISFHNVAELTIIPFNSKLIDTAVFYTKDNFNSRWDHYLQSIRYDGATQLGNIDLAAMSADLYMLFTDGNNTYGRSMPRMGSGVVHCIYTSGAANQEALQQITGSSGGKVINLANTSMSAAIANSSRAGTWLVKMSSSSGKLVTEQSFPVRPTRELLINGSMPGGTDTIFFHYGNNTGIKQTERIVVKAGIACPSSAIDRITMMNNYSRITRTAAWSSIIDFGLEEKVVTQNTAYIVLERIEDYVTYNITPPKELEEECEKLNYVKRDTRFDRRKLDESNEFVIVNRVAALYNTRIRNWDPHAKTIHLDKDKFKKETVYKANVAPVNSTIDANPRLEGNIAGLSINRDNAMSEVVVTATGQSRQQRSMGYAVTSIRSQDIPASATTVEQALRGRVPGVMINSQPGRGLGDDISIRGSATVTGNSQPLFILDGIPVTGNINNIISVPDIDNITVLKNPAAAAIYGSRASNGVIVISSKKGKNVRNIYNDKPYRLKDMQDVEYLQELKEVPLKKKIVTYEKLREEYGGAAGFYFDVAQHLFDCGLQKEAFSILMNGAEAANGSQEVLIAIAYVLEKWSKIDEAILIYDQLMIDNALNLNFYRDLAWLNYQKGNYQQAVEMLYGAIKMNTGQFEGTNLYMKSALLNEMNVIISLHKDKLDIAHIPSDLIHPLDYDLRIIMESNRGYVNFSVDEPRNQTSAYTNQRTKNGGTINQSYYWYNGHSAEYYIKTAPPGKYRINADFYHDNRISDGIPTMIRIKTFKNFGRVNQSISVENVVMDNQEGTVEIGEEIILNSKF